MEDNFPNLSICLSFPYLRRYWSIVAHQKLFGIFWCYCYTGFSLSLIRWRRIRLSYSVSRTDKSMNEHKWELLSTLHKFFSKPLKVNCPIVFAVWNSMLTHWGRKSVRFLSSLCQAPAENKWIWCLLFIILTRQNKIDKCKKKYGGSKILLYF